MVEVSDKSIDLIEDLFQQGDSRYGDYHSAVIVAGFLDSKAIEIEKLSISIIKEPSKKELEEIKPPQQYYKYIGKKLLKEKGYKLIGFEIPFCGGRADILAENPIKKETIAVECCSCRINKAIEYLEKENTVLWVLSVGESFLVNEELPLFIIKRGPNWDKQIKIYRQALKEEMEKAISLLDSSHKTRYAGKPPSLRHDDFP